MLARAIVDKGGTNPEKMMPGDVLGTGENIAAALNTTVGTGVLTGAQIATGLIVRSGSTGAYADTFDTAANIIAALTGNIYAPEAVPGTSFRLTVINSVAFANTVAVTANSGTVFGPNTSTTAIAASTWREYLVTILNAQPLNITQANTTNGSAAVPFVFNGTTTAYNMGQNAGRVFTIGATVSGAGIPAGTTVTGITTNGGGISGVTLSANATATATNVALTFGPTVQIDGLRSGPL